MKAAASASEPAVEEAALKVLQQGGTAGEALIAGFLCAAAVRPGVLFAPLQAMIAGPGVGARVFEGRSRQPGRGLPRPRGFLADQPIPRAAYVAAPGSIAALSVLHAHDASLSFNRLTESAVEQATARGATERKAVIKRVGQAGPSALREPGLLRPLLATAGRAEGGVLSEEDVASVRPAIAVPKETPLRGDRRLLTSPWAQPGESRVAEVIVTADHRGVLGALAYLPDDHGLLVPELGLVLPRDAALVKRGVPRLTPGEPLPMIAPLVISMMDARAFVAVGLRMNAALDENRMTASWSDPMISATQMLRAARDGITDASAYGVMRALTGDDVAKLSAAEAG